MPEDDALLLSIINMKLRDCSLSLAELCEELEWDGAAVTERLSAFGYEYRPELRAFKAVVA